MVVSILSLCQPKVTFLPLLIWARTSSTSLSESFDTSSFTWNAGVAAAPASAGRVPLALMFSVTAFSAVAAACAEGVSTLRNAPQARIKETDRIACMTAELRKMGIAVEELEDGMVITGGKLKASTDLQSYKDHRIAMALAIAAMAAEGESVIHDADCVAVTYPAFIESFKAAGADFSTSDF